VFERSSATADEAAAAVTIQAAFRGHQARQQLQQQQGSTSADVAEAAADVTTAGDDADTHAAAAAEPAPSWGIGSRVSALRAMLLGSTDAASSSSSSSSSSSMPRQRPGLQSRSVTVAPVGSSSATSGSTGVHDASAMKHAF
jgi:hypothetical protein